MSNCRCTTGLICWQQVWADTSTMWLVLILHFFKKKQKPKAQNLPFGVWGHIWSRSSWSEADSGSRRWATIASSAKALLDGNARRILCAEVALINTFPAGWLICRWFCTWAIPGLCSRNMCDLGKMEKIQILSIPLSVKISLSPLLVTLIAFICATF